MAISMKAEKALLNHEEWALVNATHTPRLSTLDPDALVDARRQLNNMRDKERDFSRHKARVVRGKAEPRGGSFPGTAEKPKLRKQVFAHALRRVNSEVERRRARDSRGVIVDSQLRALAAKRAAPKRRPANTATAAEQPSVQENPKSKTTVPGAKVGSVTKAGARSQAKKDG